ncbi:unnamed protein product [Closterium sp. NIES-64]|nr:unnamed protein product [Closterium sp. NIES-64]
MALPSAHDRECTAESAPVLPPRPAVSVPARPPAAADQIRRRFEDQRRPPGPRVADLPPRVATRAESAVRSGALAEPHRGRSPRRRTPEPPRSWSNSRGRRGSRGGRERGGGGRQSASDFARALERLPDVLATALRESQSATACRSVPPDAPRSLPAIVEVANRAVSPPRFVQQPPVLPGFVGAGGGPARGPYRDPRPRLEEAEYSCSTATLRQLWILSECLEALARVLRSTRASMPISRPSTFAEKPQAACLGAADEILSLLAPLQAAPSPGADAANLLARAALDLRHIAGPAQGTPGDALTACVSVVRHLWQTTRGMLSHGEAAHNVSTLIGGRSPQAALTPLGEQQAVLLGRYLRDYVGVRFHAIFSSPIERSKRTAILACQEMGVAESMIRYADELQELSQGQWERQPRARIYQRGVLEQMVAAQPDFRAPGGESQRQVEFRMVEFYKTD